MDTVAARIRALGTALLAGAALVAAAPPAAVASSCAIPIAYVGDDAPKAAIARWMAHGARARAVPGELPVMGALVESGLANLSGGQADTVGFFQMRLGIWNQGAYEGYPDNPDLQLKWFIDHALAVRAARLAAGDLSYGQDPAEYGVWVADVQRPAEQYRYRYQLRLGEARGLVGPDCVGLPTGSSPPPPPSAVLPSVAIFTSSPKSMRVSTTGRFTYSFVATPGRNGNIKLTSTRKIKVGSKKRRIKLARKSFTVPPNANVKVKYKLSAKKLKALKRVRSLRFNVSITVGSNDFATKLKLKAPKKN